MSTEIERFYTETAEYAYERWAGANGGYHYGYFDPVINIKGQQIDKIPGLHQQSLLRMQRLVGDHLNLDSGGVILDMGCGTGAMLPYLCNAQRTVIGVNVIDRQLRKAQQRIDSLQLHAAMLNADFHQLDILEDGVADRILFLESFNHSEDQQQALSESFRLLSKAGGQLVIVEPMLNGRQLDETAQQKVEMIALGSKVRLLQLADLVGSMRQLNLHTEVVDMTRNVYPSMQLAYNGANALSHRGSIHLDVYNNYRAVMDCCDLAAAGVLGYYMVRATARG